MKDKGSLNRQNCFTALASIIQNCGLDSSKYKSHSFRIGAATQAGQADIHDIHIQMLRRWQSNAYKQHMKSPCEEIARLSQ